MEMKAPKKLFSLIGALALLSSMSLGAVSAQGATDVSVDVTCSLPMTVDITGTGEFAEYDIASLGDGTSTTTSPFTVTTDVGCYLGSWYVMAEITSFDGPGHLFFPGKWFSLRYIENSVNAPWAVKKPVGSSQEFKAAPGYGGESESDIFETAEIMAWLPFIGEFDTGLDWPAPFVSSAQYNGHLRNLDRVLPGTYTAELTVELFTGEAD